MKAWVLKNSMELSLMKIKVLKISFNCIYCIFTKSRNGTKFIHHKTRLQKLSIKQVQPL